VLILAQRNRRVIVHISRHMDLKQLFSAQSQSRVQLQRSSLKHQSTARLRSYIISGKIPPGTKLTERDLADLLGVSRMPARDALMDLEREGLVVSKPNGRYVIQVGREEIDQLFSVRTVLEKLAAALAAANVNENYCAQLRENLRQLAEAVQTKDRIAYLETDLEAHRLIWQQSENPYLLNLLNSIVGPIFMFMNSQTAAKDSWDQTFQLHRELTGHICAGDSERAEDSIERHMEISLTLTRQAFD
jgi:DNA-binding GntR family transcriptional regulator